MRETKYYYLVLCHMNTWTFDMLQINARFKNLCFLGVFSPSRRISVALGIFSVLQFWLQNYEHIFPGNARKFPGKYRKYPVHNSQMSVFQFRLSINFQSERKYNQKISKNAMSRKKFFAKVQVCFGSFSISLLKAKKDSEVCGVKQTMNMNIMLWILTLLKAGLRICVKALHVMLCMILRVCCGPYLSLLDVFTSPYVNVYVRSLAQGHRFHKQQYGSVIFVSKLRSDSNISTYSSWPQNINGKLHMWAAQLHITVPWRVRKWATVDTVKACANANALTTGTTHVFRRWNWSMKRCFKRWWWAGPIKLATRRRRYLARTQLQSKLVLLT